jgi:hypothetical protein
MSKLSIEEINRIESWILKKCESLPKSDDLSFSDANLSRGIFQLLLVLLEEKRQQCYSYDPYHYHANNHGNHLLGYPAHPVYTYADKTTSETICPTCKSQNPQNTHCIHRVQMGLSHHTTGGKI